MAERSSFLLTFLRGQRLGAACSAPVVQSLPSRINAQAMMVLHLVIIAWASFRSHREIGSVVR
jgi:hypothetical protein